MSQDRDTSEDFAAMLAEFEPKSGGRQRRIEIEIGQMLRGRIVSVGRDALFVELGPGRAEAMMDLAEFRDADGNVTVKIGDEVEARVVEIEGKAGCVVLRKTMLGHGPEAKAELEQARQLGIPVEGTVTAVNKGGVEVLVAGVRGFCPVSQLELRHVEDPAAYIGRKLGFRITRYEMDRRGDNLVLSRRALLEEESRARGAETRAKLVVGAVLPGIVTTVKDYGAFVDLGGIEGMLHVSEIGYQRDARVADLLSAGQRLQVQVLKIEKTDDPKRPDRISLSLRSLERDPWDDVADRVPAGTRIKGKVVRVAEFGAFVEIEPGVDGLLHLDELSGGKQVRQARDLAKPGDVVEVTVLSVDRERRRISLGLGDRTDAVAPEDMAAARAAGSAGMGTLGDLFKAAAARSKK